MNANANYSIECSPSEWIIDKPIVPSIVVRNNETGELVPDARIYIGGGNLNLFFQTDEKGVFAKPHPRPAPNHKMMGNTPVIAFVKINKGTEKEQDIIVGPEKFSNIEEQKDFSKDQLNLPDPMTIGTEYTFSYTGKTNWHKVLYQEVLIDRNYTFKTQFEIDMGVQNLHFFVRWWNIGQNLELNWTPPEMINNEKGERIFVANKTDPDEIVQFPLMQPINDGIIRNPKEGKWLLDIKRTDSDDSSCNAAIEVYKKYKNPRVLNNVILRVMGAGVDIEFEINNDNIMDPINFVPSEQGEISIIVESPGVIKPIYHSFNVI